MQNLLVSSEISLPLTKVGTSICKQNINFGG